VPSEPTVRPSSAPDAITRLLRAASEGDNEAHQRLFTLVYEELRRLARRQLARSAGIDTLSTTAVVHEVYLKLSAEGQWTARDRSHFYALAARTMRHVLIDYARRGSRQKRGGHAVPISLDENIIAMPVHGRADELCRLDEALTRLEQSEPDLARIVEWRFFGGLSVEEIASTLEVSSRTVKRHWRVARAFLHRELLSEDAAP
jgi:RNA polymerase sigma factor (TIGR02999 family)